MKYFFDGAGFRGAGGGLARLADLCCIVVAGWLAFWLRFGTPVVSLGHYEVAIVIGALLVLIVLPGFDIYRSWRGRVRLLLIAKLVMAYLLVGAVATVLLFFAKVGAQYSRLWVAYWICGATLLSVTVRLLAYPVLNRLRLQGRNRRSVLLVGSAGACATVLERLRRTPIAGFDVGRVIILGAAAGPELHGVAHETFVRGVPIDHHEDEVWICLPLSMGEDVKEIQSALSLTSSNVRYMPDPGDLWLMNHRSSNVAGLRLLDLSCSPMSGLSLLAKAIEDRAIACLVLVLISPLMLVLAIGVRLSSPGPIFYRQERVSWNGKPFMMFKFRSMPVDVESNGVQWGRARDKQATRFGAFMRRTSLDELPQLFNVLSGEMSIVGPRPERTVFVDRFKHEIPRYMQKHMVKAGITGWAQVNGWRGDTDLQKRIECDLWYIENWSVWLDLKIILLTVVKGFVNPNAY